MAAINNCIIKIGLSRKVKLTFKRFLSEGGKETAKHGTTRATASDIKLALDAVASALGMDRAQVEDQALGSVKLTLSGHKKDSGDIDIALPAEMMDEANSKMMKFVNNEGTLNTGLSVGSYAVPVKGGKKVQVDLMFVPDVEWAKFIYSSEHGRSSKYPGAVRNIIMMTAAAMKLEPGKDIMVHHDGQLIARASRSIKLQGGLERLFKIAKQNPKTGKFTKGLDKVDAKALSKFLKNIGKEVGQFSPDSDVITDPAKVVEWLFGKGVTPADVSTAEKVIPLIKKTFKNHAEILDKAKDELQKSGLPVPWEE